MHGDDAGREDSHGRIVQLEGAVARVQGMGADGNDVGPVFECPLADLFLAARKTAKAPEFRRDRASEDFGSCSPPPGRRPSSPGFGWRGRVTGLVGHRAHSR